MVEYAEKELNIFDKNSKKKYTPELQSCVHGLLENHISTKSVGQVIAACLKLAGKQAYRLPSATCTTVSNKNMQRLI